MQIKTTKILVMATMIIMTWLKMSQRVKKLRPRKSCFSVPKDVCYLNVDKQDKTGYGNQTVAARKSQDKANKIFPNISSNGLAAAAH